MKKGTIDKYVKEWLPVFEDPKLDPAATLRYLIKEVERDTRHAACDKVNKLHNEIHNLDH